MSLHKGITQKDNGNYSFRFAISKRLQPYFHRVEFKKTYDITKHLNFKEILNNVNNIKFQYEVIKEKIFMKTLSDTEIQKLVNEFLVNNLNEDYEYRINGNFSGSFYSGHNEYSNKTPQEQIINQLELLMYEAKEKLTNVNSDFMLNIASELLETLNINIEELNKKSKLEFLYALKQSNIDFLEEQLNRTKGISKAVKLSKSKKINVISESDTSSKLTIEKATDDYLTYYKDNNSVTTKTMNEKEKALKYFLNVMQHLQIIDVDELKKSDIDTFVNKYLKQKPKQTGKLRELTNEELIISIDDSIYNDINKISTNTIDKHYQHISGFCNYLYDDGLIDKKINQANTEQELENRECFTNEDIKNINVKLKNKPLLFELFNIYIYTGLRMQELWQSTIKTEIDTNIIYFDVAGTKTKESTRKIPMHSELIKLGITQDWLSTLKSSYKNNKSTSRKINAIIKEVVNGEKKSLYSTRHFFTTELLKANVSETKIDKLVGHSDKKNLKVNTYGRSAFTLEILKIEIEKINLN